MSALEASGLRPVTTGGSTATPLRWDGDLVEKRVEKAFKTQAAMSGGNDRQLLRGMQVAWPDYQDEKHTAYGAAPVSYSPMRPSPNEITLLDEVIEWMTRWLEPTKLPPELKFPPDVMKIVWSRAGRAPWPKIIRLRARKHGIQEVGENKRGEPKKPMGPSPIPGGNSHESLRRIYYAALAYLAQKLNEAKVPVRGIN